MRAITASHSYPPGLPERGVALPSRGATHARAHPSLLTRPVHVYLLFILAVQSGLSMWLVWSNTAFGDEALYISEGKQELAHWLHHAPLGVLRGSGAPQIYPPIAALMADAGGVTAARLLSLLFMVAATALLYCIGVRLFDRTAALAGAALWAVSEPVLRLAFATYDPLACLLVIVAAWLAVRAIGCRRIIALALAATSAATLAVAAITAVSFTIMIPVVIAITFFAWADRGGWVTAIRLTLTQVLAVAGLGVAGVTALGQWHDLIGSTLARKRGLGQGVSMVLGSAWNWDRLIFCLAACAVIAAIATHGLSARSLLVTSCAMAAVLVPVYQAYLGTGYSMDKHMTAGSAFAALAAGYGLSRLRARLAFSAAVGAALAAVLLMLPAIDGEMSSRSMFHSWANVARLTSDAQQFSGKPPVLVDSGGGHLNISLLRFYVPGGNWASPGPRVQFAITHGRFSGVVADLSASPDQAASIAQTQSRSPATTGTQLLTLHGIDSLIASVVASHRYTIVAVIPYSTTNSLNASGLFVVWRVTVPPAKPKPRTHHRAHPVHHTPKPGKTAEAR